MAGNSNNFYVQQYASAVELLAQQVQPKIASTFSQMTAVGKAATVANFIDPFEADERSALYEPIVFGEPNHTRPWVYPRHFDKALPFDNIEQMQMSANPSSSYVQGVVAALNRRMDDEAIRALYDTRMLGENGTTAETFPSANQVSVNTGGTTSGLNVEKLQNVLELMRAGDIEDNEVINIVISPKQERQLMNEVEAISTDFTSKALLDRGTVKGSGYMGFNWIISNRLPLDTNSYRRIPVYTMRGMSFCAWNGGIKTDVTQRKDLRGHPWQVYGEGHFGAVRRDKNYVYEIKAAES